MGIMDKNENLNRDMIDILRDLHKYVPGARSQGDFGDVPTRWGFFF